MYKLFLRSHGNMAASSLNAVRVRLYFDYPPPSMPDCRMSWVLVDLNKCRVVADLCSVIRQKFDYSRKTVLDLFIENCFLPPAENIYLVRDNDSIRVKVSSVYSECVGKKRCREEEGSFQAPAKKNRHEENGVAQAAGATKKKKRHKAKKKKRDEKQLESGDAFKAAFPDKEPSSSKAQTEKSSKKASASSVLTNGKAISSGPHNKSSDSSDSSEEVTQKPSPLKSKSKHTQVAASKRHAVRKTSSSDSSSSEDEKVLVKKPPKPCTSLKTCTSTKTSKEQTSSVAPKSTTNSTAAKKTQKESSSDSSSSDDEASAAARRANVPAKSTTTASKPQPQTTAASSSEEDDSRKGGSKTASLLQTGPPLSSRQGEASKNPMSKKPSANSKTSKTQTTTSDSSSSSEDEACKANVPTTPKPFKTARAQTQPCSDPCAVVENGVIWTPSTPVGTMVQDNKDKAESSESCSSDTELVIKRPNPLLVAGLTPRGRGRGFPDRVKGRGGVRGGFGRARGTPWKQNFHHDYDNEVQRKQKEIQTNKSLVLQNPPEPSPKRDYSTLPLLAAPPAVGQKIVFKLLELTENYTPEVSDYKEGKIIGFNHSTNMIELELLMQSQARTEPGKFDLVYQNPDGTERVEYAVTLGSQLTERWESLLEPRLIVQNTD
ncbi:coilin isoform X1 [Ictalurus punctatus]|uniref:Coilin isoform X1 n=1 Tax=Ictalurus punctatus TaxID=7998 RepID=A0A2D0PMA4_ICTPU|nr:coilin isoform X1 [Ictalurus punctatus]